MHASCNHAAAMLLGVSIFALAILAYTYVGYPALVFLFGRLRRVRSSAPAGEYEPPVSVILPVYNGAERIGAKLDSLLRQVYPPDKLEILVCSDGSTDGTDEIVAEYALEDPRVRLFRLDVRSGKPTALNLMRRHAGGEVLVLTDARQPLASDAVSHLVRELADPSVGCVSGNLVVEGDTGPGLYWKYETFIRQSESRFRGMVGVNGPLYAMRRDDLEDLPEDIILDDLWVPMRLRLRGKRIVMSEVARAYDRSFEIDREMQRKVRTLAGNYQLFFRSPRLLLPFANPSWFETFSHKVMRLVCPWALAVLLLATLVGAFVPESELSAPEQRLVEVLLCGQIVFYGCAALGARVGRIGILCRTFFTLHLAALIGLWRFVTRTQKVTW